MPKTRLVRTSWGFGAADDKDLEIIKNIKIGEVVVCNIEKERNPKFHRLVFGTLNLLWKFLPADYKEIYPTPEHLRQAITITIGYVQTVVLFSGEVVTIPKSWSFEKMDNIEFKELFDKYDKFITSYFVPKMEYPNEFLKHYEKILIGNSNLV